MDNSPFVSNQTPNPSKLRLSLDYRIIVVLLLLVIAGMLFAWKPWFKPLQTGDRTVSVTGEATVKAEPDEYVFYPTYEFKNADKQTALNELTKKSDEIVTKLKALGVTNNQIKTNANGGNDRPIYYDYVTNPDNSVTYTLELTVTVSKPDLAQKVQDYLASTTPTGSVSPEANFSDAKRKQLESQARDQATKDARAKADQSAKNLGFKVGAVKSVTDGSGFGSPLPMESGANVDAGVQSTSPKLTVQPGENDLSYSVTVVYFVR